MTTEPVRIGMRFDRRDTRLLDELATRCEANDLHSAGVIYRQARDAARTGEPWIVECVSADEARSIAAEFVMQGVRPPSLDQVSGKDSR